MRIANNTIRAVKEFYYKELSTIYPDSEILWFFRISSSEISGLSLLQLHLNIDDRLPESELIIYSAWVKRLKRHEPIQYITGKAWFMDLELVVDNTVLIPRPETEELVNLLFEWYSKGNLKVLDACTGSGCIALAIKNYLPNSNVYASDISADALNIAKINADNLGLEIKLIESNLLKDDNSALPEDLDVIISNPPYIPYSEKDSMAIHVAEKEPSIALFVEDNDALIFYKRIADLARTNLKSGGIILVECHCLTIKSVVETMISYGLREVTIHNDLSGKERFVTAKKA